MQTLVRTELTSLLYLDKFNTVIGLVAHNFHTTALAAWNFSQISQALKQANLDEEPLDPHLDCTIPATNHLEICKGHPSTLLTNSEQSALYLFGSYGVKVARLDPNSPFRLELLKFKLISDLRPGAICQSENLVCWIHGTNKLCVLDLQKTELKAPITLQMAYSDQLSAVQLIENGKTAALSTLTNRLILFSLEEGEEGRELQRHRIKHFMKKSEEYVTSIQAHPSPQLGILYLATSFGRVLELHCTGSVKAREIFSFEGHPLKNLKFCGPRGTKFPDSRYFQADDGNSQILQFSEQKSSELVRIQACPQGARLLEAREQTGGLWSYASDAGSAQLISGEGGVKLCTLVL